MLKCLWSASSTNLLFTFDPDMVWKKTSPTSRLQKDRHLGMAISWNAVGSLPKGRMSYREPLNLLFTQTTLRLRPQFQHTLRRWPSRRLVPQVPEDILLSWGDALRRRPSPPPGISIIQEDKVSRTWEWKAARSPASWVNILTVSSNRGGIRGDPSMESVLSCSGVSATSASASMKCKELKAGSRCVGTVCAHGLTNLTTDWLWKWLSSTPPVLLLLFNFIIIIIFFCSCCCSRWQSLTLFLTSSTVSVFFPERAHFVHSYTHLPQL